MIEPLRLAAFVSPHGFGHAARCSAVIAELHRAGPVRVELFTTAPRWFFDESIEGLFRYHEVQVDVGFRQRSALEIDLDATTAAVDEFVPFDVDRVADLGGRVQAARCQVVLCDIAPIGVAVAETTGIPSIVVENFSWGWLYQPLTAASPRLAALGRELDRWMDRATRRVQARPVCLRDESHELVDPISREPRLERAAAREALGIDREGPVVVVTMGGYGEPMPFIDRLRHLDDHTFVVTGTPSSRRDGNLLLFDNNTPLFMPDVLRAADAVVAKLGYGTVSEVWREGLPFAHVTRSNFREMASLEAFAAGELSGFLLSREGFATGAWIDRLDELLAMPRRPHEGGGARRVAAVIREVVDAL